MKVFRKAVAGCVMCVLLFAVAACSDGGMAVSNQKAWEQAFADTFEDIQDVKANVTITTTLSMKMSAGGTEVKQSSSEKIVFADGKAMSGLTYYERIPNSKNWDVYEKNDRGNFQKTDSSEGPYVATYTQEDLLPSAIDSSIFELFDFKNGKYVLNLEKYLKAINASYSDFDEKTDKISVEVTFKNGKIYRIYMDGYRFAEKTEVKTEIIFKFGGAKVIFPWL